MAAATVIATGLSSAALAVDLPYVEAASIDQPRIYITLEDAQTGIGIPEPEAAYIDAFLDTGASGLLISKGASEFLGLTPSTYDDPATVEIETDIVEFGDVGVGGIEIFNVSKPVNVLAASFHNSANPEDLSQYQINLDNVRLQMRQVDSDFGLGPAQLNVFGMPLIQNRVMVFDARPLEAAEIGYTHTFLYERNTPFNRATQDTNPGIPQTSHTVKVSYGTFDDYTFTTPDGAPGPTQVHNPFIGPSPTGDGGPAQPPGVDISFADADGTTRSATGSWLLDTGAGASILSEHQAEALGVYVIDGASGPVLQDIQGRQIPNQFSVQIGGVGAESPTLAGFYLDTLTLPTIGGDPLVFHNAAVLVGDITVTDADGNQLTLDGVLGMNFFSAAFALENSPNSSGVNPSWFNWFVFDEQAGTLGLDVRYDLLASVPEPASAGLLTFASLAMLARRAGRRSQAYAASHA